MGKWTYVSLNVIFFTPVIIFAVLRYWTLIKQEKKFILAAGLFGFLIFFIVDIVATYWMAWEFDPNQTLGIRFGKSVLEELVFGIIVSIIVAVAISAGIRHDRRANKKIEQ